MQQPSFPLRWVSFQLLVSWSLKPFIPPQVSSASYFQWPSFLCFPPQASCPERSSDLIWASGAAAALSMRILWFLACQRMVFWCMVFAYGLSFNMILRFFSGFFFRTLWWIFLRGAWSALWISGFFKILLRSVLSVLCMGSCSYSWGRLLYAKCRTAHLTFGKHFQSKCRNIPHDQQEQVSKCSACLH